MECFLHTGRVTERTGPARQILKSTPCACPSRYCTHADGRALEAAEGLAAALLPAAWPPRARRAGSRRGGATDRRQRPSAPQPLPPTTAHGRSRPSAPRAGWIHRCVKVGAVHSHLVSAHEAEVSRGERLGGALALRPPVRRTRMQARIRGSVVSMGAAWTRIQSRRLLASVRWSGIPPLPCRMHTECVTPPLGGCCFSRAAVLCGAGCRRGGTQVG